MKFIPFEHVLHGNWVRQFIQPVFTEGMKGVMAHRDDGSVAGGVILDCWTPNSCQVHIGAETPMVWKHGLHKEVFKYVFETTGRKFMFGFTPSSNDKAINFNEHIGFKEVYRVPDGYADGIDFIVYRLDKAECEYLEISNANIQAELSTSA